MFQLMIVSLTPDMAGLNNNMTAVSMALVVSTENQPYWYLDSWAMISGMDHTAGLAKQAVGYIDNDIDQLRKFAAKAPTAPTSSTYKEIY
jgi:hypothetical protein